MQSKSPTLFSFFIRELEMELENKYNGAQLNETLIHIYADDIVLFHQLQTTC